MQAPGAPASHLAILTAMAWGLLCLFCASSVLADTHVYVGGAGGDWDLAGNWTVSPPGPAAEPVAGDTANIGNGAGPTVSSAPNAVGTLNVGNGGTGTLNFTGVGGLSVSALTVLGQQAGETGTITLNSSGLFTINNLNIGVLGTGSITQNSGSLTATNLTLGSNTGNGTYIINGGTGSASSSLIVGGTGTGTLNLNTGGIFTQTAGTFNVGRDAGSSGTVNIDGAGSTLNIRATNPSIGQSGHGEMHLTNGGTLNMTGSTLFLGATNAGDGELTINGSGSLVTGTGGITVGNAGDGIVTITNGGDLSLTGASAIGSTNTGNGTVTVDGAGSTWRTNGLTIGNVGNGTFSLTNGGQASILTGSGGAAAVVLGSKAGSTGALNVTGAGSQLTSGTMHVGAQGQGTLDITGGGTVNSGTVIIGQGAAPGITSTATLDGAGSTWTAGGITVGSGHDGELSVTGGAVLTSSGGTVGNATASGLVEITDSTWNADSTGASSIAVGASGVGTLNVLNSTVQTSNRLLIGTSATGNGTMLLDNSDFTLLPQATGVQGNTIEIGRDGGTGALTVRNASTLEFNAAQFQLGTRNTQSQGTLIVEDAGTIINGTGSFTVGQNGAGHLQLLDNAVINAGSFTGAANASAITSSDILIDDATLNIAGGARFASRGILNTTLQNGATIAIGGDSILAEEATAVSNLTFAGTGASITGGGQMIGALGAATINFNQTGTSTLAPALRGHMTLNQNSGTSNLGGDGDYTGASNINGGTLQATVTDAFSQNSAYHMNGGILNLNGLDNEIGSLDGSSNVTLGAGTLTTGSLGSTTYSGIISGTGGLTKTGSSIFTLDSAQTYTGLTTINQGTLHAGVTDAIATSSGLIVNSGTAFNMGGFDQTINGNVLNNGLIDFGLIGHNLTITGNLTGNGLFRMDTNVAALIGDHIDIQGTSAGNHLLKILNAGGTPLDPTQGLEVVSTTDGVAQFSAVGGTVDVGLLAYTVQRGNGTAGRPDPTNWYLVMPPSASPKHLSEAARAILNTAAGMSNTWFTQMDNLHRRMGQQRLVDPSVKPYDIWVRGYSRKIEVDDSVSGRPFDEQINGVDAGIDKVVGKGKGTWLAGAFAGYGWTDRSFNSFGSDGETTTPYAGLYSTWFDDSYYVDLIAKVQYFDNSFDAQDASGNLHRGDYDQWGYGASAEVGRHFRIGNEGWSIEPQAQLQYIRLAGHHYVTHRGTAVDVEDDNVYQARAGIEIGKTIPRANGGILYPYGRVSIIDQFSSGGDIKADAFDFNPNLTGANLEYGAGFIYQADDHRQGYITFTASTGEHYDQDWGVNAGFRYEF